MKYVMSAQSRFIFRIRKSLPEFFSGNTAVSTPGLLSWVVETRVKCGDNVKPTLARVGALSTLQ